MLKKKFELLLGNSLRNETYENKDTGEVLSLGTLKKIIGENDLSAPQPIIEGVVHYPTNEGFLVVYGSSFLGGPITSVWENEI